MYLQLDCFLIRSLLGTLPLVNTGAGGPSSCWVLGPPPITAEHAGSGGSLVEQARLSLQITHTAVLFVCSCKHPGQAFRSILSQTMSPPAPACEAQAATPGPGPAVHPFSPTSLPRVHSAVRSTCAVARDPLPPLHQLDGSARPLESQAEASGATVRVQDPSECVNALHACLPACLHLPAHWAQPGDHSARTPLAQQAQHMWAESANEWA